VPALICFTQINVTCFDSDLPPPGMASRAFTTRFIRTCLSCPPSASITPSEVVDLHHRYIVSDRCPKHVQKVCYDVIHVYGLRKNNLLPGKSRQLLSQRRCTAHRSLDVLQVFYCSIIVSDVLQRKLRIAVDYAQDVIEIERMPPAKRPTPSIF